MGRFGSTKYEMQDALSLGGKRSGTKLSGTPLSAASESKCRRFPTVLHPIFVELKLCISWGTLVDRML